jgi:hypothetical protein
MYLNEVLLPKKRNAIVSNQKVIAQLFKYKDKKNNSYIQYVKIICLPKHIKARTER